ncbi:MAG TPA: CaiB/BaiF CoA-transferase family protein [Solirubrobacterales bacterium]|nr:CaiB/BaiF CoA-transferase family protein [Solirubrobacterales bacterium]
MATAEGPLAGVRVLDLSRLLPGGFCTAVLGDLGADVVKIEQPGKGDYMRWGDPKFGAESAASWTIDRNKRSVCLDLKHPDAVAALHDLAGRAQVVVESFRPGVVDRLGVGYEALRGVNAAIVYCSISGHGQTGPLRATPGHDINYVGRAGILDITGPAGGLPAVPGVQVADLGTGGLFSVAGILAALYRAQQTGEGDHIDISMTDGALAWLSIHLADYFASGVDPGREGMLLNGHFPCYHVYRCADGGHITVGAIEDQFWEVLCERVGRPDLLPTRVDPTAIPTWREVFAGRPRDEWVALLGEVACVGPVNDFAEAAAEPQMIERGMIVEQQHPEVGAVRQLGSPLRMRNHPVGVRAPAPKLGAHTRELLADAGYSAERIGSLLSSGAAA